MGHTAVRGGSAVGCSTASSQDDEASRRPPASLPGYGLGELMAWSCIGPTHGHGAVSIGSDGGKMVELATFIRTYYLYP